MPEVNTTRAALGSRTQGRTLQWGLGAQKKPTGTPASAGTVPLRCPGYQRHRIAAVWIALSHWGLPTVHCVGRCQCGTLEMGERTVPHRYKSSAIDDGFVHVDYMLAKANRSWVEGGKDIKGTVRICT